MFHPATKVHFFTERLLQDQIIEILDAHNAPGYTITEGSGKGEHFNRSSDRASVVSAFAIVRIEVIIADRDQAEQIAKEVADKFFKQYAGIVYLTPAEVLRVDKF